MKLTSTAWRSTENVLALADLQVHDGAEVLFLRLEREFGKLQDTTLFAALDKFFYGGSRSSRQSLIELFVTFREQLRHLERMLFKYSVQEAELAHSVAVKTWKEDKAEHLSAMIAFQWLYMEWSIRRMDAMAAQGPFIEVPPERPIALEVKPERGEVAQFLMPSVISGFFILLYVVCSSLDTSEHKCCARRRAVCVWRSWRKR